MGTQVSYKKKSEHVSIDSLLPLSISAYSEGLDTFEWKDPAFPSNASLVTTPLDGSVTEDEKVAVVGRSYTVRSYSGATAIHRELAVPPEWYRYPNN